MSLIPSITSASIKQSISSPSMTLSVAPYTYQADPSEFDDLTGWWEAFDASTLYTDNGITPVSSNGQTVYRMADKSGSGKHWIQATSARRPTYTTNSQNSLSGLTFDGSNHYMGGLTIADLFGASAKTLFLAFKMRVVLIYEMALFGDVVGYWKSHIDATTALVRCINYGGSETSTGVTAVANTSLLYTYWHDTAQTDQKNNGTATTPVTTGATDGLGTSIYLGGLYGTSVMFDGVFYGGAAYNRVLSVRERNLVNQYFINTLAIT